MEALAPRLLFSAQVTGEGPDQKVDLLCIVLVVSDEAIRLLLQSLRWPQPPRHPVLAAWVLRLQGAHTTVPDSANDA